MLKPDYANPNVVEVHIHDYHIVHVRLTKHLLTHRGLQILQKALAQEKPWNDLYQVLVPALGGGVYTITREAKDEGNGIIVSFEMAGIGSLSPHGLHQVSTKALSGSVDITLGSYIHSCTSFARDSGPRKTLRLSARYRGHRRKQGDSSYETRRFFLSSDNPKAQ